MKNNNKTFVVGFITDNKERVLLINKNRPESQKGLYNGVGGAVKKGEKPYDAMIRETKEETGLDIDKWTKINKIPFDNGITLHLYHSKILDKKIEEFENRTDEKLGIFHKYELPMNLVEDVEYIVRIKLGL